MQLICYWNFIEYLDVLCLVVNNKLSLAERSYMYLCLVDNNKLSILQKNLIHLTIFDRNLQEVSCIKNLLTKSASFFVLDNRPSNVHDVTSHVTSEAANITLVMRDALRHGTLNCNKKIFFLNT